MITSSWSAELLGLVERRILRIRAILEYERVEGADLHGAVGQPLEEYLNRSSSNDENPVLGQHMNVRAANVNDWLIFTIVKEGKVVGHSFLHTPECTSWLDSLPTYQGECRESGTYIDPAFRGLGLRAELLRAQSQVARAQGLRHWAVIETSNVASLRSAYNSGGRLVARSILLKAWGRNLISIVTRPPRVWLVAKSRR